MSATTTATVGQQVKALLRRNLLIKKRTPATTACEFIVPVFLISLLAVLASVIPSTSVPEVSSIPAYPASSFLSTINKTLVISPNSSEVRQVIDKALSALTIGATEKYEVYDTEQEGLDAIEADENKYSVAVIFSSATPISGSPEYKIRPAYDRTTDVNKVWEASSACRRGVANPDVADGLATSGCPANQYLYNGFITVQAAVDYALIAIKTGLASFPIPDLSVQMLPLPEYDQSFNWLQGLMIVYMPMVYMPMFTPLLNFLVSEKQKKIKDSLQMMGMREISFWISWAVIYLVIMVILTFIISGIMFGARVFQNSNYGIVLLLMLMSGWALLAFVMMFSVFFKNTQLATILTTFVVLGMASINYAIQIPRASGSNTEQWGQWLLCLLPPAAMGMGIDQAAYLDFKVDGAKSSTLMYTDNVYNFPLGYTFIMLAVDIVLYSLLGFYLEAVCPCGRNGRSMACCFCYLRSYWGDEHEEKDYTDLSQRGEQVDDIEPVSPELQGKEAIRIYDMKKKFATGQMVPAESGISKAMGWKVIEKKWAVNGVSLDLYEGHITALLGHNGAGKSTLINMVTGLLEPTSGTATIYNQDILDTGDVSRIRGMVGICPQHDNLYPELSVWEHLQLVAKLRGIPAELLDSKVEELISLCDLSTQVHTFAKDLSGGQKRKLSMGIALMGDPKVLFLDEPTAGMDPYSRRKMWTLLQKIKKDRTILLTTHFMDEADILADRKAILTKGKLRCCGSSLYLKNKFGIGYHLNMVVDPESSLDDISNFVMSHVPGASLSREHGRELAFTLPATQTNTFPVLFAALEEADGANARSLGISNYGISMPTLEEVFLKLGEEPQGDEEKSDLVPLNKLLDSQMTSSPYSSKFQLMNGADDEVSEVGDYKASLATGPLTEEEMNEPLDLPKQQFRAVFKARWILFGREPWVPIVRVVLPVFLVIGGLMMLLFITDSFDYQDPVDNNFTMWPSYQYGTFLYKNQTGSSVEGILGGLSQELSSISYEPVQNMSNLLQQAPKLIGYEIDTFSSVVTGINSKVTLMYNQSAVHGLPMMLNAWSNALYGLTSSPDPAWTIAVSSQALPELNPSPNFSNRIFNAIRVLGLGLAMLCGWYGYEVLQDRERNTRGQMRVSGVTAKTYWSAFLLQHSLLAGVISLICVIILVTVNVPEFKPPGAILCSFLLIIIYCPMMLVFSYASSFLFDKAESYVSASINASSILGFLLYLAVSLLQAPSPTASTALHFVFMVFVPYYHIYGGLHFIAMVYQDKLIVGDQDQITVGDYFRPENKVLFTLIILLVHFCLWTSLLRLLEVRSTGGDASDAFCGAKKRRNSVQASRENRDCIQDEDVDVSAERQRVANLDPYAQSAGAPVVVVKDLRKEFSKRSGRACDCCCGRRKAERVKVAVRNLTFAVSPGEVFGLLGHNGAGKTTCLMTVTAEHAATKGNITVAGYDVNSSLSDAFVYLGTCPQHDRLFDHLTTKEHLELYAAIGGVPLRHVPKTVNYYLKALKIEEHEGKKAKDLSGGTKRKLSFAMAMMGKPKIVLLDEPSTGMDPTSKRFLWDTITATFKGNRGAILTTHYMEEADALCNRVGIMVGGELKCVGPTQHLKERFGEGYLLEIKLQRASLERQSEDRAKQLDDFVKEHFPQAHLLEMFGDRAQYKIPQDGIRSLSSTFAALESGKQIINIEEYSFSQSTLEQVFIEFTRSEYEAEDEIRHDQTDHVV